MKTKRPTPGEVRPVSGGYGLMLVVEFDETTNAAHMRGHGPPKGGHWFTSAVLGAPVDSATVREERAQAGARNVACNDPDCWCVIHRREK